MRLHATIHRIESDLDIRTKLLQAATAGAFTPKRASDVRLPKPKRPEIPLIADRASGSTVGDFITAFRRQRGYNANFENKLVRQDASSRSARRGFYA